MKRLILAATALGAIAAASPASAALLPITGDINLDGSDAYTATTVSFVGSQNVQSVLGSFTAFGTCSGCITAKNITYSPFVGPLNSWFSGTNNAQTFSLDLTSVFNVVFQAGVDLDFDGNAVLHLTGFADTPGEVFFSTQGPGSPVEVSFSATAVPTPEPASLSLMGVGLLGLGMVAMRKRNS